MEVMGKLYTVEDIAKMTGLTSRTIRNYLKDGSLEGRKIGGQWRFTMENIEKLFNSNVVKKDIVDSKKQDVIDFIDGVNTDINGEIQICTIIDYYCDKNETANIISNKIIEIINNDKTDKQETKYSYIYDEKELKARFTLFGRPDFIIKILQIIDDLWNYHYSSHNKFTDRAKKYSDYRPSYSNDFIDYLYESTKLSEDSIIADIGSGTGKLSKLLIERGNTVMCVEPNDNMRSEAEKLLSDYKGFNSINATAEETTLQDNTIDLIACGTSFHWFDKEKCHKEFKRILKSTGKVDIVWNGIADTCILQNELADIYIKYCPDYVLREERPKREDIVAEFFRGEQFEKKIFYNTIDQDFESLKGGCLSSSFAPKVTDENYAEFINELENMFNKHSVDGKIKTVFAQESYLGEIIL